MKLSVKKIGDVAVPTTSSMESWRSLSNAEYQIDIKNMDMRTTAQNSALHLLYSQTAKALGDAGHTVNVLLNHKKNEKLKDAFVSIRKKFISVPGILRWIDRLEEVIYGTATTDLPWTMETVKELIWRPLQMHVTKKKSTTKLNRVEIDKIYDIFNKYLADRAGVHIPFPSKTLWDEDKK